MLIRRQLFALFVLPPALILFGCRRSAAPKRYSACARAEGDAGDARGADLGIREWTRRRLGARKRMPRCGWRPLWRRPARFVSRTRAKTWDRVKITTADRQFGPGNRHTARPCADDGRGRHGQCRRFHLPRRQARDGLRDRIRKGRGPPQTQDGRRRSGLLLHQPGIPQQQFDVQCEGGRLAHACPGTLLPRKDGNLLARWSIDGHKVKELATKIPETTRFGIHCSVENLKFLGDHQPTRDHEAVFDRVSFTLPPVANKEQTALPACGLSIY